VPQAFPDAQVRAILFDVDGTLVDSIDGIVQGLHDAFVHYGNHDYSPAKIRSMVGTPLIEQMKLALGTDASDAELEEAMAYTMSRYAIHNANPKPFEDAVRALELASQAGIPTALVTSKNAAEMDMFLPKFKASSLASAIVCASDIEHPKPAPDCVLLACDRLGVQPQDAIMVGDSVFDLQSAKAAGAAAAAVTYGSTERARLQNEAPDFIFDRPAELLDWVRTIIAKKNEKEEEFRSAG
jgi:HAD superfamily hydrolase (TIGR01509 family)